MRKLLFFALPLVALAALLLWRLGEHDLSSRQSAAFRFESAGTQLVGTLWQPDTPPHAGVVLVHGDGPQDRLSGGGYAPLIHALLDAGIAVASYDKPGIGESGGDWLGQSMADRQAETAQALDTMRRQLGAVPIGALGFSQAGWVVPYLHAPHADFLMLVGAAVSWQDQGRYFTRRRLEAEGATAQDIAQELARQAAETETLFGPSAQYSDRLADQGIDLPRWQFIQRNMSSDSRADLSAVSLPLLAIWGREDLNVDAARNAAVFAQSLAHSPAPSQVVILDTATHGLLNAQAYNYQLPSQWPLTAQMRFVIEGRVAFAPQALSTMTDWILRQAP